ncbi:hypothetical protein GCM10027343_04510 [Noviherbaspirillum agri]
MYSFFVPFSFPFIPWQRPKALRIDVQVPPTDLQEELSRLYERLHCRNSVLFDLPVLDIAGMPGLLFRYRVADGEHYIYVEDPFEQRLAGYTVFNRLIEVSRRADRHLRAPHSRYAPPYQRRGIASAIYAWWLGTGGCLITGARQSTGANALWHAMARDRDLFYVELRNKELIYLGRTVDAHVQEDLHTRMILLADDWNFGRLAKAVGMRGPAR